MRGSSTTRSNGRAAGHSKPNGKDITSAERGRAASDDATGASVANAGPSTAAAGADHTAYAEAAHAPNGKLKKKPRDKEATRKGTQHSSKAQRSKPVPPGRRPLPEDGADFIETLHAGADFAYIGVKLLNSEDEKIVKSVWERMLDIKYGEGPERDETPQVIFGHRRPHDD